MPSAARIGFFNANLVLPDGVARGAALRVEDGVIAEIDASSEQSIDCAGDYLLPGLVEIHTDNVERCLAPRDGAHWPTAAAVLAHDAQLAAAGVTTALNALMVGALWTSPKRPEMAAPVMTALDAARSADALKVDHRLHLRVETTAEDAIEALESWGARDDLTMVSLMDHSPGQRQFRDLTRMADFLAAAHGIAPEGIDAWAAGKRARAAETTPAARRAAAGFAKRSGAVLASHDDETPAHVDDAAALGATIAEFPTTLAAAKAARAAGMTIALGAPNIVRGQSLVGNVSALDLAEQGLLDVLSSDYAPHSLLQAAFALAGDDEARLPAAIACASGRPAAAVALADRGRIAPGLRADLIRVRRLPDGSPTVRGVWRAGERVA